MIHCVVLRKELVEKCYFRQGGYVIAYVCLSVGRITSCQRECQSVSLEGWDEWLAKTDKILVVNMQISKQVHYVTPGGLQT